MFVVLFLSYCFAFCAELCSVECFGSLVLGTFFLAFGNGWGVFLVPFLRTLCGVFLVPFLPDKVCFLVHWMRVSCSVCVYVLWTQLRSFCMYAFPQPVFAEVLFIKQGCLQ